MTKLKNIKMSSKLRNLTPLRPITHNATRWPSIYHMLERYIQLKQFLDSSDVELAEYIPTALEDILIRTILDDMNKLHSITALLQKDSITLGQVRDLFDSVIKHFPTAEKYLSQDARIIKDKEFERLICKLQNKEHLEYKEKEILRDLKLIVDIEEIKEDDKDTSFVVSILNKRTKVSCGEFEDTSYVPPTSNIVERLFSIGKKLYCHTRPALTPFHFEMQLYLFVNRTWWDISLVNSIIIKE